MRQVLFLALLVACQSCDPRKEICHKCTRICSRRTDDHQLFLNSACRVECRNAIDNCHQRNANNAEKKKACEQVDLRHMVEEFGDIPMKVLYDVHPTFGNFDRVDTPDGCIRRADMDRISDILDGSNADGGYAMPAIRGNIWASWQAADTNHNGCVDEKEFDASDMKNAWGKSMPTPQEPTDLGDVAATVGDSLSPVAEGIGDAASATGGAIAGAAGATGEAANDASASAHDTMHPPDETVSGEAVVHDTEDFLQRPRRHRR